MKIKSKLDTLTTILFALLLILLSVVLISSKYVQEKTVEFVNVSRELDYLTLLRSSLIHLEFNLETFIMNPKNDSKKNVEEALDKLYKVIGITNNFKMDEDETEIIIYLRENFASFSSIIYRIITDTETQKRKENALFESLKKNLFIKLGHEIDKHWEEDIKKIQKLQKESGARLVLSSRISIGVFVILFLSVFIIRNLVKRKLIEPIYEISRLSYEMAGGNLDSEIKVTSRDELEDLAKNFNLMARTLKEKLRTLEKSVKREQKMVRELAILNDFVGYASSETEFEIVLRRFVEIARDLIRAEAGAIYLMGPDFSRLYLSTEETLTGELVESIIQKPAEKVIESQSSIMKNTLNIDKDGKKIRNLLCLPIRSATELECLLILVNKNGNFTNEDEDSLFNFAFQAFYIISLQNKLAMLATTDGLTGLYNHRTFQTRLTEELLRAERYKKSVILLLLDIDHFKRFNDTYGHQTGDEVLKTIAKIIKNNTRKMDFPARYGGEEFAIILPESDCSHAKIVAERIRTSVMEYPFYLKDGTKIQITVSIGVSCFPKDTIQKEDLIKKADKALYNAKNTGRNRVSLFGEG